MSKESMTFEDWAEVIEARLGSAAARPLEAALQAIRLFPGEGYLLVLAGYAALVGGRPDIAFHFMKRFDKHFFPEIGADLCRAIALAQMGRWPQAQTLLKGHILGRDFIEPFAPRGLNRTWLQGWIGQIHRWRPQVEAPRARPPSGSVTRRRAKETSSPEAQAPAPDLQLAPLARVPPRMSIDVTLPAAEAYTAIETTEPGTMNDFLLRYELTRLSLLQSFDDLLCLSQLRGVEHFWYQVETARKVLKNFRGRVLLADEVGLGKTIEAGMVLKEYLLRGMVESVLILTPPALVRQWREEMEAKFSIQFAAAYETLAQKDPAAFWKQPRILASIAMARRPPHSDLLAQRSFDLVIVDEAHHLKNRTSKNWKLVDGLKRRFLLLLSATPLQNNLVELYNLLTLLKPGIFKTEREFRAAYVSTNNPRVPANREQLQGLMRDVMIRNTRSQVDVHLPARNALTIRVTADPEEQVCYEKLSALVRSLPREWLSAHHTSCHNLLEAAGSSPRAARSSLERFLEKQPPGAWPPLHDGYLQLDPGAKARSLVALLQRNPEEKKMVFVRFRETLGLLEDVLTRENIPFVSCEGRMSGPEKDAAVDLFRTQVPVLLSTESGGEGRNVQFCNSLINFDLPWNPQLIEQRIGRIHRIGQQREVFIFNLALNGTAEEQILRILDEKLNMFELVVGEIQSILGEEEQEFATMVFSAWIEQTDESRRQAFEQLTERLVVARKEYEAAKALDEEVFGDEFEAV